MMKLGTVIPYLKGSQKYINHVTQPLSSADISISSPEINKFCYIKKYRFLILLPFFEFLRIALINMAKILLMSAKMATLDFLN